MKFNIYTLGCKVNTYESEALTNLLEDKGFTLTLGATVLADIAEINITSPFL